MGMNQNVNGDETSNISKICFLFFAFLRLKRFGSLKKRKKNDKHPSWMLSVESFD
jgi:hypothetical protein